MKRIFTLLLLIFVVVLTGQAQKTVKKPALAVKAPQEAIDLMELAYDFGKIPQGHPVTHHFEIINKSKLPVMLSNVEASCGCTTPEWSEAPIAPGSSSVIKVGFNAAAEGHFSKTITIIYNNNQVKTFAISGDVYPSPTTSAPLNPSLSLIK